MITEQGYLERPYLQDNYMSGFVDDARYEQVDLKIESSKTIFEQVQLQISTVKSVFEQALLMTSDSKNTLEQINLVTSEQKSTLEQVNRFIQDFTKQTLEQATRGKLMHRECGGYLSFAYLTEPYLGPMFCVDVHEQVDRITTAQEIVFEQIEGSIDSTKSLKEQIKLQINASKTIFEQVDRIQSKNTLEQITIVLYNATNLRILCDFPSRGVSVGNWSANSTAAGDFGVANVNTDIVEQIWKSNSAVTGIILTCDTGVIQGVFVDTVAILNHNMTTSASIVFQGSNDAGFSTVGVSITMTSKPTNIYYIAPTLPLTSYRYWRFLINDPTNTGGSIYIGTIVFGSSIIMQQTCITQTVLKSTKHFSDKVATEGFTNVSNDRALKYAISLEIRNLSYDKGDYTRLRGVFDFSRTSLKCLWIPTPQFPDRFAVFGKLTTIPQENHNVIDAAADYVSFGIEVDESL